MEPIRESPYGGEPYGAVAPQYARTLTQFIQHLLDTSSLASSPVIVRKIQKEDKVSLIREQFPEEYQQIERMLNFSELNGIERNFCLILINNFLTKRGLIKYQSLSRATWEKTREIIDLEKVYRFIAANEMIINSLKEAIEKWRNLKNSDETQIFIETAAGYFSFIGATVELEFVNTPLLINLDKNKIAKRQYIAQLKTALDLKNKISRKLGKGDVLVRPDDETRCKEHEFVLKFVDVLTISQDMGEFRTKLKQLTQDKTFRPEFLKQLFILLKEHESTIRFLALSHKRFREDYFIATGQALIDSQTLLDPFADEPQPVLDPENKVIKVSYAQFYFALVLFNKSYKWMLEYATCEEEKVLAAHILAILVCGGNAPPREVLIERACCFLIREFADSPTVSLKSRSINLDPGVSFVQDFLNNLGEEASLEKKILDVIGLFVGDCIERAGYDIDVGDQPFVCGFYELSHLEKPFFMEEVLSEYIIYLNEDPNRIQNGMKNPLFKLVSENRRAIIDYLLERKGKNDASDQMIMKIVGWFERIKEEDLQGLVMLKFIEVCTVINQTIPSNCCRLILNELYSGLPKEIQYFIAAKQAENFYFSFEPPASDFFRCVGIFPIWIRKHQMNFFFDEVQSAELRYDYSVPSLEEIDHAMGRSVPSLITSHLAFSPFTTPSFVEFLGGLEMNQAFIKKQESNRKPQGIITRFSVVLERLDKFVAQLNEMDLIPTIASFQFEFLQAFAIDKMWHLLDLIQIVGTSDQNAWKKKRKEVTGKLDKIILKLIEKYQRGKKEEEETHALQEFLSLVRIWFPELKKTCDRIK